MNLKVMKLMAMASEKISQIKTEINKRIEVKKHKESVVIKIKKAK